MIIIVIIPKKKKWKDETNECVWIYRFHFSLGFCIFGKQPNPYGRKERVDGVDDDNDNDNYNK